MGKGAGVDGKELNQQIGLREGRRLGYAEYGARAGKPIFYFHGFPGSRLDWRLIHDEEVLLELDVRVIAPDRPGYGLSDQKQDRCIVDWTADVCELADELQIGRFGVLGVSGGGPYAAACGARIGDRLTTCGIVCGMGPPEAPGMKEGVSWAIPGRSGLGRRVILMLTSLGLGKDPAQFLAKSKEAMAEVDGRLLDQPEAAAAFIVGAQEAFRGGIGGAVHEAALYGRPWGFELHEIAGDVYLWHGEQDLNVLVSVGRYVGAAIPNCTVSFQEMEGHLTLPRNHIRDILRQLSA